MNTTARDSIAEAISYGFNKAANQIHARHSVKQLVASLGQYFPYASYNSTIALKEIAANSLTKAILATDYQPIPQMEAWSLHSTDLKTAIAEIKAGTDIDSDFRIVVGYTNLEDGLAKTVSEMNAYVLDSNASMAQFNTLIADQAEVPHLYKTNGHIPAIRAVSILELIRVYLLGQSFSDEDGGTKLHSNIGRSDNGTVTDVSFILEDVANNLFVEISVSGLV